MSKNSLLLVGLGLLLASCGGGTPTSTQPEKATIGLSSELPVNYELVDLNVDLRGLTDVEKVVFYRDGKVLGEDRTAPFTWRDEVTENREYQYQAVAYRSGGRRDYSDYYIVNPKLKAKPTELTGKLRHYNSFSYPLQLTDWQGGAGEVRLKTGATTLSTGALKADGTFTLPLATPPNSALLPATAANLFAFTGLQNCTGDVSVSPADSNAAPLLALGRTEVAANVSGPVAPVQILPPTTAGQTKQVNYYYVGSLVYAQSPMDIQGSLTCPHPGDTKTDVTFELILAKGWNKIVQQYTVNPSDPALGKLSFSMDTQQAGEWVLLPRLTGLPLPQ